MSLVVSSFMPSGTATVSRAADVATAPIPATPQAMTIYVRFIELGLTLKPNNPRLLSVGLDVTGPCLRILTTGGVAPHAYRFDYKSVAGVVVTAGPLAAAPTVGQLVELRASLSAAGVIQLGQSIAGAAETLTGTNVIALPQAWSDQKIHFLAASFATVMCREALVLRGVQSLATCQRWANTVTK